MLLRLGYVPTLVVSSVEMVKEITNNHDVIFADRPSLTGVGIVLNGCLDMAFGPYCDYSREVKKLCVLQLLSHKRVQQFHFIREEEVEKIVERIQRVNGAPINLSDMFTSLAHNILSRSAFGSLYEDQNGVDTTAATMEFMMAELIKNPRIMKKAQEEIRRVVGNSKSNITVSDINQMEYLKCVMKETLRFHASGAIARQTSANVKLKGYDIPAKTRVIINTWAIHMDPTLWDRPEEFLPERFLDSTDDSDGEQKNPLFSFGTGTRVCPGMSYAYAEVEYAIANLLYWFDWELPDGARVEDLDMSEVITIVIRKKTPLWVVAHSYFP
ncbi:hypothetical protein JCGZ_13892 [Jatropha curcas]|uniref:Uncharacterized protein n=1 Tax=Jatropha curcas TaxID=180498 RepID=A0A067JVX8_JATCU|nr:hypothetical protein JCGZ_13892 [Jatropha curcas]